MFCLAKIFLTKYNLLMENITDIKSLREALVVLMRKYGVNQLEISQSVGLAQSSISLFISGKRSLNGDSALKIQNFIRAKSALPPPPPETQL